MPLIRLMSLSVFLWSLFGPSRSHPQGKLDSIILWPSSLPQGKLDDGSSIELSLEVSAVDPDDRASSWDLPLLKPTTSTGSAAAAAAAVVAATGSSVTPPSLATVWVPRPASPTAYSASLLPTAAHAAVTPAGGGAGQSGSSSRPVSHVGRLHFMVHGVELDPTEFSKPVDAFFLLR